MNIFQYECIKCRACEKACSIFITTGKYGPVEKLEVIELLLKNENLTKKQEHTIFYCNKCEGCQEACPQEIPLIELYDWARHEIYKKVGFQSQKQAILTKNILNEGNPFGKKESRLKGVSSKILRKRIVGSNQNPSRSKVLLHLGCMLSYRLQKMRDDVLSILDLLEVDFSILRDEHCCGYFIFNTGDHESAKVAIEKNLPQFEEFNTIICACAGCYIFFKKQYPNSFKFKHIIEIIDQKMRELQLKGILPIENNKEINKAISFHDSCHLTRPFGITQAPRNILKTLKYKINEFPHSGKEGLCCGADGGMRILNPELALKIGTERVKEAKNSGSSMLLTLCPFCIYNFREANLKISEFKIGSLYREILAYLKKNLDSIE
ncbi:MAG: (Fe-S)-binding protein [Promethearchaeota archaeon]